MTTWMGERGRCRGGRGGWSGTWGNDGMGPLTCDTPGSWGSPAEEDEAQLACLLGSTTRSLLLVHDKTFILYAGTQPFACS